MSFLKQARRAVFGETWELPVAVAGLLCIAVVIKHAAPEAWEQLGGPLLLGGAVTVLIGLVERGRPSRPRARINRRRRPRGGR
jgi:hypothetical protein